MATLQDRYVREKVKETARLKASLEEANRKAAKSVSLNRRLKAIEAKLGTKSKIDNPSSLLTPKEAAKKLRLHERTIRNMCGDGRIKCSRLGNNPNRSEIRIHPDAIEEFLTTKETTRARALAIVDSLRNRR